MHIDRERKLKREEEQTLERETRRGVAVRNQARGEERERKLFAIFSSFLLRLRLRLRLPSLSSRAKISNIRLSFLLFSFPSICSKQQQS